MERIQVWKKVHQLSIIQQWRLMVTIQKETPLTERLLLLNGSTRIRERKAAVSHWCRPARVWRTSDRRRSSSARATAGATTTTRPPPTGWPRSTRTVSSSSQGSRRSKPAIFSRASRAAPSASAASTSIPLPTAFTTIDPHCVSLPLPKSLQSSSFIFLLFLCPTLFFFGSLCSSCSSLPSSVADRQTPSLTHQILLAICTDKMRKENRLLKHLIGMTCLDSHKLVSRQRVAPSIWTLKRLAQPPPPSIQFKSLLEKK